MVFFTISNFKACTNVLTIGFVHTRAGLTAAEITADTSITGVEVCKLHDYKSNGAALCFVKNDVFATTAKVL
jgi:hypothetical protein